MVKYSQKCQKLKIEKRGYENVMEERLCKVLYVYRYSLICAILAFQKQFP
jgi:hypothetical protein